MCFVQHVCVCEYSHGVMVWLWQALPVLCFPVCLFSVCACTQVWGHDLVMAPPPSSGAAVMLALQILQGKVCTPSLRLQP